MDFTLTSAVFIHNAEIPKEFTCDGANMPPPLEWHNPPEGTKSFTLIIDDPDAPKGTWDHMILYNVDDKTNALFKKGLHDIPNASKYAKNSFDTQSYGGPCPPHKEHRYFFKIYALDNHLIIAKDAGKAQVEKAMKGHILGIATLIGRYNRPQNRH